MIETIVLERRVFSLAQGEVDLEVVARPEELIGDPADEYQIPCWAEVWPAALALASYLSGQDLHGQKVLELGCGLGLPGLVAALRGAIVTFNDYHPEALELVGHNARRLGLVERVRFHQGDWRCFTLEERFDLVLASDVMYDPKLNPFLLRLFNDHVAPGGRLVVSHPNRRDTLAALDGLRGGSGWTERSWEVTVATGDPLFPEATIRLHCLTRLVVVPLPKP